MTRAGSALVPRVVGVVAVLGVVLWMTAGAAAGQASDGTPPSTPGPVRVAAQELGSITLTWAASTDDVGVAEYLVAVGHTDYVALEHTPTSEITLTVSPSRTYRFWVHAVDAAGNESPATAVLTVTVLPGDDEPPTRPGAPVAEEVSDTSLLLQWERSRDNVGPVRYEVLSLEDGGDVLADVPFDWGLPWRVTGLAADTEYRLAVRAVDDAGNRSARSPVLTVRTLPAAGALQCTVDYEIISQWDGGFQAVIGIRNDGVDTIDGWTVRWGFPDGQAIAWLWGGSSSTSGDIVSVAAAGWNAVIPPGGTATFGFTGRWRDGNAPPERFELEAGGATSTCASAA